MLQITGVIDEQVGIGVMRCLRVIKIFESVLDLSYKIRH